LAVVLVAEPRVEHSAERTAARRVVGVPAAGATVAAKEGAGVAAQVAGSDE
jgi:hypothetical protein